MAAFPRLGIMPIITRSLASFSLCHFPGSPPHFLSLCRTQFSAGSRSLAWMPLICWALSLFSRLSPCFCFCFRRCLCSALLCSALCLLFQLTLTIFTFIQVQQVTLPRPSRALARPHRRPVPPPVFYAFYGLRLNVRLCSLLCFEQLPLLAACCLLLLVLVHPPPAYALAPANPRHPP